MKHLAIGLLLAAVMLGCDATDHDVAQVRVAAASSAAVSFPFGLSTFVEGSAGLRPSRRKVCFQDLDSNEFQCVESGDIGPQRAVSWNGSATVTQIGLARGNATTFEAGPWRGGYENVVRFRVGTTYFTLICGAGEIYVFRFEEPALPGPGAAEGPGLHLTYVDDGDAGDPSQHGIGGYDVESLSSPDEVIVSPLLILQPINSGPACEL